MPFPSAPLLGATHTIGTTSWTKSVGGWVKDPVTPGVTSSSFMLATVIDDYREVLVEPTTVAFPAALLGALVDYI